MPTVCLLRPTVTHCPLPAARPYGVSSLLAVHDKAAGPQLYLVEPSGAVVVVSAVAALLLA